MPGVEAFEVLREVSPKNGFVHGLSMEFADRAAYDAYNEHPEHVAFVQERWLAEVTDFQEIDYEAQVGAPMPSARSIADRQPWSELRGVGNDDRPGRRLDDADVVAERVAQPAVDAVEALGRLVGELDALGLELLVGLAQSSVRRPSAKPAAPLVTSSRTCSAVASSWPAGRASPAGSRGRDRRGR